MASLSAKLRGSIGGFYRSVGYSLLPTLVTPGNSLPPGYIFRTRDGIDIVGLSITEFYAACPVAHRSIYSADGTAFYDAPTIVANIEAFAGVNNGGELIWNQLIGAVQYPDGTVESILRRAYRYFGIAWPETFGPTWAEPGTWNDELIWSE